MSADSKNVSAAMLDERAPKARVREEWMDLASELDMVSPLEETLYTTLCGEHAIDVRMAIARGLVELAENGAIADSHKYRIVAVESNKSLAATIKSNIAGLTVVAEPIQSVLRGTGQTVFPTGNAAEIPRARVVNLDLNANLRLRRDSKKGLTSDVLDWIRKLAVLHSEPNVREPWALCLTVQGEAAWDSEVSQLLGKSVLQAAKSSTALRDHLEAWLQPDLGEIAAGTGLPLEQRSRDIQQRAIGVFVARRIAQIAHSIGWVTIVRANWRYGGEEDGETAPMCTWALHFTWSPEAREGDELVLKTTLDTLLANSARVDPDGTVVRDFDR